jgi:hypothetical protein
MKLDKKVAAWLEAGLLAPEQAQAIRSFEEKRSGNAGAWIVAALGAVGGLALVTGVISLVASNWDAIPPWLKLAVAFSLLAGSLAFALAFSRAGRTLVSDLFLFAHAGLVLAMIGLVGQIYQLSGASWRALALATALALPASLAGERSLLVDVVIAFALATLGLFLNSRSEWHPYFYGFGLVLLGAAIGGALLLGAEWIGRLHPPAKPSLRRWGTALLVAVTSSALSGWVFFWFGTARAPMAWLAGAVAAAWVVRLALMRRWALVVAVLALSAFVLGAGFLGQREESVPMRFLGFALFCTAGGAFAIASAQAGSRRLTNIFTFVIAARIVALYLEMTRSLSLTGGGLLLTGAVFCGVAWAWWKLRGALPVQPAGGKP